MSLNFFSDDVETIIQKLFPPNFQYILDSLLKTREFYEFILVDFDSAEITHTPSKNNASKIAFSKLKIFKVISLSEWNQSIYIEKTFSEPYNPPKYNYVDYQKAWFYVLFLQPNNHLWFMHFVSNIQEFPTWFFEWWMYFSPILEICSELVQQGFELFKTILKSPQSPRLLVFVMAFRIPWIICWDYCLQQRFPNPFPLSLVRCIKVKWWTTIDNNQANSQAVKTPSDSELHTLQKTPSPNVSNP